ncbi:MAG TPA: redoxin domain-containing protein [Pyrinomonadaceae bacterium]|nr:redoxin domain-containing protein [Pyrinomonadaceae bacterium]
MKRKSFLFVALAALLAFIPVSNFVQAGDFAVGSNLENFKLSDTTGKERSFNDLKGKNGAVLVFLSIQCPVVKGYDERIVKLAADLQAKGVNVIGINSNATEPPDAVAKYAAGKYKFPVLIDKDNVLADKLSATVTPETLYVNEKNVLLYRGAIDNDRSGAGVTESYLQAAIDSTLSGKPVAKTSANAFGCSIKRKQ